MAYPFAPRYVYGPGPTTLNFMHSQGMWDHARRYHGGGSISDAGVPETYIIRKEGQLKIRQRIDQTEWLSFLTMIDWIFDNGSLGFFDFYPNQNNLSLVYTCFLLDPMPGKEWDPARLGMQEVYEVPMTLKRTNNGNFDIQLV